MFESLIFLKSLAKLFIPKGGASSGYSWGSGSQNVPSKATNKSEGSKSRKCGLCRQEGHTRSKCPRKNDFDM